MRWPRFILGHPFTIFGQTPRRSRESEILGTALDDPEKWWKLDETDYAERKHWNDYRKAYEDVLERCSTKRAPWYVIPADHKWFRNLAVASIVADTLEELDLHLPKPAADLEAIRREYEAAAAGAGAP